MKIVCESCQAKYSIADEKVAGKVFKIRCKRCSEVIIVRGDQQAVQQEAQPEAEAAAAAPPAEAASDAIWHVVVNGEQFGPYVPVQIGELLATGQIDWEAFVWREGFDNWMPAADVPELVDAIMGPGGGQAAEAAAAAAPAAVDPALASTMATSHQDVMERFSGPASMGADPFAEEGEAGGGAGGLFGEPAAAPDPGADLFGSTASPFDGGADAGGAEGVVASAASPQFQSGQQMTGARNENSVLFSLKNLQALATGSGTPEASFSAGSPGAGAQPGAGLAAGEGSGLIDIRALASAAGIGRDEEGAEEKDELLAIGSQTGAFGSLGSPMAPTAPMEEGSRNKTVFAILGGAALVGAAMIAVAVILKPQPSAPTPAPAVGAVAPVAPAAAEPADKAAEEGEKDESQLSEGEKAARERARAEEEAKSGRSSSRRARRRSSGGSSDKSSSSSSAPSAPAPAAEPAKPKMSTGKESIDDLLAGALGGGSKKAAKPAAPSGPAKPSLPRTPSRDAVLRALRGVQPAVSACAQGQRGVAMADIVVASSGRVKSVRVSQVTGPVASCIARAVRKAKFPAFGDPTFSVKFPFKL
jgi:predicted Zn finger-like uncharacterized protein